LEKLDPETRLIVSYFGNILYAMRKRRNKLALREGDVRLDIHLPQELHEESYSLFSHLNSPALILHSSGDMGIPVNNAFFLEQKMRQNSENVTRSVLLDCDHWFRNMPSDIMQRVSECLNGSCVHNGIDNLFYQCLSKYIWRLLQSGRERSSSNEVSDDKFIKMLSVSYSQWLFPCYSINIFSLIFEFTEFYESRSMLNVSSVVTI
jgi:hypothetical protein